MNQRVTSELFTKALVAIQRSAAATRRVQRALSGVTIGPVTGKALRTRYRRLLAPAKELVTMKTADEEGFIVTRTYRPSRLGLAGHLAEERRDAVTAYNRAVAQS